MDQIEISSCGIDGSDRKRSSDISLSKEEPPRQKQRSSSNVSLSEGQLQKMYDVKPITFESEEGYYAGPVFVPTGEPELRYKVYCKVCERFLFLRKHPHSLREDSDDFDCLQKHVMEHIEGGFIDCEGKRLRDEIPVRKGYRRACEYCGRGFKVCGSGAYVHVVQACVHCSTVCKHDSEDCPSKGLKGDWRESSPCCPIKMDD